MLFLQKLTKKVKKNLIQLQKTKSCVNYVRNGKLIVRQVNMLFISYNLISNNF
jgi:hypothetical protein